MNKTLRLLAGVILLALPCVSFASIDTNLSYGAHNQQVTELQEFLIDKGYLQGQSTGNFYSLTLKAVKAFQTANNIPSTGYVGVLTRTEINSELATELASSTQEQVTESPSSTPLITPTTQPISVFCSVTQSMIAVGQSATWTAQVAGGNGTYSYLWSGSSGLSGTNSTISWSYNSAGINNASVTVTSGSQSSNITCGNTVTVYQPQNPVIVTPTPTQNTVIPTVSNSPSVDIKVNGSDGPISVFYGATPTISWTSQGMLSCGIVYDGQQTLGSSGNLGLSGNFIAHNIYQPTTITIKCNGQQLANGNMVNNNTISDSVTINVDKPQPTVQTTITVSPQNYGNNNPTTGIDNTQLASFTIQANGEDIKINSFTITPSTSNGLKNIRAIIYSGIQLGLTQNFDGSNPLVYNDPFVIQAGQSQSLSIRGYLNNLDAGAYTGLTFTLSNINGTGVQSGQAVSFNQSVTTVPFN